MRNIIGKGLTRRTVLGGSLGVAAGLMPWRAGAASRTVKVGSIMPSSGVLAFPGQSCVRGIDLGARFAKERFGVEMEIIHADTQSKPENGRIAADSLIRQGCTVLIGAWDSGATISALQAAEAAKVPMVVHVASATQVTSQGFTSISQLTLPDRKMLETAKALSTRPRLLLLDEVMAGLRPTEAASVVRVLHRLVERGLTILLVEHVMRIVMEAAENVVVLHHGAKIAEGVPQYIVKHPEVLAGYLGDGFSG